MRCCCREMLPEGTASEMRRGCGVQEILCGSSRCEVRSSRVWHKMRLGGRRCQMLPKGATSEMRCGCGV